MNTFLLSFLLFSIVTIHLTSSASFPNPPQVPSANATPEDWTLFWKLLHNYYAIIARPRFGKRYDSFPTDQKHPSYFDMDQFNENLDQQNMNINDLYTFIRPDRRRRR